MAFVSAAKKSPKKSSDKYKRGKHSRRRQTPLIAPGSLAVPIVQRTPVCACDGGCPSCLENLSLGTYFEISKPGDRYEQEADRMADQVLHMPEPKMLRQPEEAADSIYTGSLGLQANPLAQREAEEKGKESLLVKEHPSRTSKVLKARSQPLTESARSFFEPRFSFDFSQVKIHVDTKADTLSRYLNACAFTVGQDIFFRHGEYNFDSLHGREILAHELAHVVQRQGAFSMIQRRVASSYSIIKDNLSYRILDWAITNEDAREVLQILSGLSPESLHATVQQMRRDEILGRLQTNISESDRIMFSELLDRIQGIEQELAGLPDCCKEVLKRIDDEISAAKMGRFFLGASPFIRLLGHVPLVQLQHVLETHWDLLGEAVNATEPILKYKVYQEIALHLLDHTNTPEGRFWKKMEALWR